MLLPVRLSSDYAYNQIPVGRSLFDPGVLAALLVLLTACALAVLAWYRRPVISFGIAVFALTILPVSNLAFPIGTIMAERVLYLPSLGFCLLLAVAVMALAARPRGRLPAAGAIVLLLLGYGTRTILRNRDWHSNAVLFAAAVSTSPNSAGAHYNLGMALLSSGDFSGAQREFERSLGIYPKVSGAYSGLGETLEKRGQIDAAAHAYQIATKVDPNSSLAHLNLGYFYGRRKMTSEALEEFRSAARLGVYGEKDLTDLAVGFILAGSPIEAQDSLKTAASSNSFMLRSNLGLVYLRLGWLTDAQRELEMAAALEPNSLEVQMNLGKVHALRGVPAQAEAHFKNSLRLQPGNLEALNLLATVLGEQGRLSEAQEALETVLRLQPSNGQARYILGVIFAKQGRLIDAQRELEAVLRVTPQDSIARRALSEVLRRQGRTREAKRELHLAEEQERRLRSAAPRESRQRAR
ncbi:MAG: tetratricopeptide repeat protein [candidate division NC10 bacterium]|nr:tetratricopeptide repeat protein [candidate division NC10 bacterium]